MATLRKELKVPLTLEQKIDRLEKEREELFEKKKPIDARLVAIHGLLEKLVNRHHRDLVAKASDTDIMKMMLDNIEKDSDILRKKRYEWAKGKDLMPSGYWTETLQPGFQVMLNWQSPIDNVLAAIKELVPYYRPHKDGYVRFGILEHTLSKHYSFNLLVSPDLSKACIARDHDNEYQTGTLEDTLKFISAHLWYQRPRPVEEETEYDDPYV